MNPKYRPNPADFAARKKHNSKQAMVENKGLANKSILNLVY